MGDSSGRPRSLTVTDGALRFEGTLWWPIETADGQLRIEADTWVRTHHGWRIAREVSWLLLAVTPLVVIVGFGYVAGEPSYPGEPPLPFTREVAVVGLWWPVVALAAAAVAESGLRWLLWRRRHARWVWQAEFPL